MSLLTVKLILVAILAFIFLVLFVPKEDEDISTTLASKEAVAYENAAGRMENKNIEISGNAAANEKNELKNPFIYNHETRVEKSAENISKNAVLTKNPPNPQIKYAPKESASSEWKLTGIVIGKNGRTAVLFNGKESVMLQIGDTFGDKRVTAIETDFIAYDGDSGEGRLTISP